MSVVPYQRPEAPLPGPTRHDPLRWIALLESAAELAAMVAETDFVPKSLRGNRAAIAAAILYGDEVGLGPMQSLAKIKVIEGTPTLAAETQRGLILAGGHRLWFPELSTTRVRICGQRAGEETVTELSWSMDDARRAGVAGRQTYRAYPRQMLTARASAELARLVFADVIGGLRATEEIEDGGAEAEGSAANQTPDASASPQTARRRRRASTLAPVSVVTAAPEPPPPALPGEGDEEEPPAPESDPRRADGAAREPGTEGQRRRLMALFRAAGMQDRGARLAWASKALGRAVPSSTDLTFEEASKLIDLLDLMQPDAAPARSRRSSRAASPPETNATVAAPAAEPAGHQDTPPVAGGSGFIDSLEFVEPVDQPPLPLAGEPRLAELRVALDGMGKPDRTDLLGLLCDLGPNGAAVFGAPAFLASAADDPAPVIAEQWPELPATPRALCLLRDQLADLQRDLER